MKNSRFEVKMSDGIIRNVTIEDYDSDKMAEELNNTEKQMIAIGDIVVQRFSVVRIIPAELIEDEE